MSTRWPATPEDLYALFEELGVAFRVYSHLPLHTVEESKRLRGEIPGAHCKSLFLKDRGGRLYLAVCLEFRRLDMKRLAANLEAGRLSFASAELLWETLGVRPGAVTPFALVNDRDERRVTPVLDRAMLDAEPLNYHPLHNEATVSVSREGLELFLDACGHARVVLDFDELSKEIRHAD